MFSKRYWAGLAVAVIAVFGAGVAGVAFAADFPDVPSSNQYYGDVMWATGRGVAAAYPDGTFRPNDPLTRNRAARWFHNYNSSFTITNTITDPAASDIFGASRSCPSGYRALAGGGSIGINGGNVFMVQNTRIRQSGELDRWYVSWETENNAVVDPYNMVVWVLCAPYS